MLRISRTAVAKGSLQCCNLERMDKTIRKYDSFDEMKADEYGY